MEWMHITKDYPQRLYRITTRPSSLTLIMAMPTSSVGFLISTWAKISKRMLNLPMPAPYTASFAVTLPHAKPRPLEIKCTNFLLLDKATRTH